MKSMTPRGYFSFMLYATAALLVMVSLSVAQDTSAKPPPEEQNQTWLDTLKKMQIRREEEEHKKLVKAATEVKENAELLLKDANGSKLPRSAEKKLKEIEKGAKKIRSESGSGDPDKQLDPAPSSLEDALRQLSEASKKLQAGVEKTSRHVVSAAVVTHATEVIQLVKLIRGYLN
jgi:hypothetical protein